MRYLPFKFLVAFLTCFFVAQAQEKTLPPGLGVPVLLYHGVTEQYNPSEVYTISKHQLREHLGAIKLAGFTSINTHDLYDYFYKNKSLPAKSFMICFDDAPKSIYYSGDPILKEFGFQAVMGVTTLMQEKDYPLYLSWAELNEAFRTGRWDLQAHGYQYHNLIPINEKGEKGNFGSNLMWLEKENRLETLDEFKARLKEDLIKQKNEIEIQIKGTDVIAFIYPFGDWGPGTKNLDSSLAIAIAYEAVNEVYPLSFGNVEFDINNYTMTSTPHLIVRLIDNGSITPQQIVHLLESLTNLH